MTKEMRKMLGYKTRQTNAQRTEMIYNMINKDREKAQRAERIEVK